MAVILRKIGNKKSTDVKYNQWINDIVLKGKAHEYEVIKTWDLVMVRKKTNGVFKKHAIMEIEKAKDVIKQNHLEYDYVSINIEKQIKKDITKSSAIKKWRFVFTVRNTIKQIIMPVINPIKKISLAEWIAIIIGAIGLYFIIKSNH